MRGKIGIRIFSLNPMNLCLLDGVMTRVSSGTTRDGLSWGGGEEEISRGQ